MLGKADHKLLTAVHAYTQSVKSPPGQDEELPGFPDHEKLWRLLRRLATDGSPEGYPVIFNEMAAYKTVVPEFCRTLPPVIQKDLDRIADPTRICDDHSILLKPYIRLLPFFEGSPALAIVDSSIDFTHSYLLSHHSVPITFVKTFGDVLVEEFNESTFRDLIAVFRSRVRSDKATSTILVLSELALEIARIDESTEEFFNSLIIESLSDTDPDRNIAGCHLLHRYGFHYLQEPDLAPSAKAFLKLLLPLMRSPIPHLETIATKAAFTLVKARVFHTEAVTNAILNSFFESPPKELSHFFKLLHVILYPIDDQENETYDPKMDDLVPIRDFVIRILENPKETPLTKGYGIDLFSDLMSIKRSFVSKHNRLAYDTALTIIRKKQIVAYPLISAFLVANCQFYPKRRAEVDGHILTLVEALSSDRLLTLSARLDLAIDIHAMITLNQIQPIPQAICAFALSSLSADAETERLRAAALIRQCISLLTPKQSLAAVMRIVDDAKKTRVVSRFEFLIRTLRKLVKHATFDPQILSEFMNTLCHGKLTNFPQKFPPFFFEVPKFLCTYMKKWPPAAEPILTLSDHLADVLPIQLCPRLFILFITALPLPGLIPQAPTRMAELALRIFNKCEIKHAIEACAPLECLIKVLTRQSDAVPTAALADAIAHTNAWLSVADLNHQEHPHMQTILEIIPAIAHFVFLAYASDKDLTIDRHIVKRILNFMPFPPDAENNEAIVKNALKVAQQCESLRAAVSLVVVEILILSEADRAEFKISPQLIGVMTIAVRGWLAKDLRRRKKVAARLINPQRDGPALDRLLDG
jgi:hypothetical protein